MGIRFRGEQVQRVDDKCRLSIPAGFRQALEQHGEKRLVMVRSERDRCVVVFSVSDWAAYEDKLLKLPRSHPAVDRLFKLQVASCHEVEPDKHGRVVLPPTLRGWAHIEPGTEALVAGQIDRFEIWARARWDARLEVCESTDDAGSLTEFGL